jgi:hypothetical protein
MPSHSVKELLDPEDGGNMILQMLGIIHPAAQPPLLEELNLQLHCCEKVRSHNIFVMYTFL